MISLKNSQCSRFEANRGSAVLGAMVLTLLLGSMVAILVTEAETFAQNVTEYNKLLTQFTFKPGEKYSEFREGDRVAEYGLAALVAGGAAAAVWKFKGLWKLIGVAVIAAFVAIGAFFKKLFRKQ